MWLLNARRQLTTRLQRAVPMLYTPPEGKDRDKQLDVPAPMVYDTPMRVGIAVLVVTLGGFTAWASLVPLTEGVAAIGSVVVATAHKTIQHLEGGIVETLHIHEGSEVKQGDILIELSETKAHSELELLESRYYGQLAEIDRLKAERMFQPTLVFSEELRNQRKEPRIVNILAVQQDLFMVRRHQYDGQLKILRLRIGQLKKKILGLEVSRVSKQREQALLKREVQGLHALYQKQLLDQSRLLNRQQAYEQIVGEIGSIAAEIAGTQVSIGETRQEMIQLEHTFRTEVSDRITVAQQEWFETRERLEAIRDVLRRTKIVAPQDGKIIGLAAHTIGGVIPPGQPIMDIVPSTERLMVEAQVQPTDINNVYVGQPARLRFSAFNQRTTPEIVGEVERVSPDAFPNSDTGEKPITLPGF